MPAPKKKATPDKPAVDLKALYTEYARYNLLLSIHKNKGVNRDNLDHAFEFDKTKIELEQHLKNAQTKFEDAVKEQIKK